jgi:hypothetical protein
MKALRLAAIALMAGSLAIGAGGCNTLASIVPAVGNSAVVNSSLDEVGMIEGEAAYNVALHSYNVAKRKGWVSPALKARARPLIVKAAATRKALYRAYDAGNAADLDAQIVALKGLAADIQALVPKRAPA